MADPILITCNACKKQLKVPPVAMGKKVRCKKCKAINDVPARTEPLSFEEEAVDAKNPYIVTETSLAARCPHCAGDIDPPDSRICLNCGYDLEQRNRRDSRVVMERTAADFIIWHLPTLACVLGIVAIILGCLFYHFWLPSYVLNEKYAASVRESRWNYFDDENAPWVGLIFHWGIQVWGIVIGLFLIWKCLVFIYKRLRNFLPPEKRVLTLK